MRLRQLAAPNPPDQQQAPGNREKSEAEELDRPVGRVDAEAKHQQRIDDHRQRGPAPGEGSALSLEARIPCVRHCRASTMAALADSARMQIDRTTRSLEYGNGRECLIAISLAFQRW
jgi:hypothetical protein